ncbi:unnamed protein product [Paramecium octaurelia]|uniref:WD domain, G-beta repeat protein n=1 Tax=Paramecium octaurelia TaxID=43137 RepID=A0A8S1X0V7_PAROT|nr:unnamed protein product [Paramecium octaurelia]
MQFIQDIKELKCTEHEYKIIHINRSQNIKMGARVRCEKCTITAGGDYVHIDDFLKDLDDKIGIVEGKEKVNLNEFEKFSIPLEQVLANYKDEFNSTVSLIINEVQKVKQYIHEYFSIFEQPLESQSLSQFENICHKVCSNVFDQFNLKNQYSRVVVPIKQLINMQKFYSNKLITCFKQLQNDMTNYEHTHSFNVQGRVCTAMTFGQSDDTQIIAMALENQLKIYELLMEKNKVIERQCFKHFTHNIASVVFSDDTKYLVAGGTFDKRMNIYVECPTKKKEYELKAELIYQNPIFSIIFTPNNEDLISGSGCDLFCINNEEMENVIDLKSQKVNKFSEAENKNKFQLDHSHNNTVYQLNHYHAEGKKQKLISCSYDKQIFIWLKQDTWNMIKKIRLQNSVYRCSFVGEDSIVVQENSSRHLTFYNQVLSGGKVCQTYEFNDLNTDLSHNFPMIYLEPSNLLIVKHNSKIVFFKKRSKNGIFYKEDEKNGEIGTITPDAKMYMSWDREKKRLIIYQQIDKFQVDKQLFDERYSKNQSKITEERTIQNLLQTNTQEENQLRGLNTNVENRGLHSNDIRLEINNDNLHRDINTDDNRRLVDINDQDSPQLVQFN